MRLAGLGFPHANDAIDKSAGSQRLSVREKAMPKIQTRYGSSSSAFLAARCRQSSRPDTRSQTIISPAKLAPASRLPFADNATGNRFIREFVQAGSGVHIPNAEFAGPLIAALGDRTGRESLTVLIDGYAGDRQPMATIVMQDFACCSVPSASTVRSSSSGPKRFAPCAELNVISRVLHFFS